MAATEGQAGQIIGSVVCAALCLPGTAHAQQESAPDEGRIAFKWMSYQDRQPGLERIRVRSPSALLRLPLGSSWSVDAVGTLDAVSGASPRYHTAISGASRMSERRRAGDLRLARLLERGTWTFGVSGSDEADFRSRAVSLGASNSSADRNLSWQVGVGLRRDRIGSRNDPGLDQRRRTVELLGGASAALSRTDLVQLTLTHAHGEGYYDDPYKTLDRRPDARDQTALSLRWNHHLEKARTTLRSGYRYYRDSFGIRSHTAELEAAFEASAQVTIAPSARLYTQSAASFYFDPVYSYLGAPYPPGYLDEPLRTRSADQRLAAFGAVTVGLKIAARVSELWDVDVAFERYEQRTGWRIGGPGSTGLAPLTARVVQVGVGRRF